MENLAFDESYGADAGYRAASEQADRGAFETGRFEGELPAGDFVSEIDAWARHAMAANGFGDF